MHIETDCVACIFNQALRVTKALKLPPDEAKHLLDEAACLLPTFSLSLTPPENATPMYTKFSEILGKEDIYATQKREAIEKAESLVPFCETLIETSDNPLDAAVRIAIAGNVIDLASEYVYDLEAEIRNVLQTPFAVDHIDQLLEDVSKSKKLVYLADNAGENVFDRILIKYIKQFYPKIKIFYFVRTKPIINDICVADLENDPIHRFATVVDSGVKTPGIVPEALSDEAKRIFEEADTILSKGMGNYECLSEYKERKLYYLLKVKCQVVARSLALEPGDLVCKNAAA